jgi:hypothetical protein
VTLPLAAASERLTKRKSGRPRKPTPDIPDAPHLHSSALLPRLLHLEAAAAYLSVSPWTVRDLEAAGVLKRVRVPLPNGGELRKVLLDREDLDQLITRWKDLTS